MSSKTKTYPMWLFWIEMSIPIIFFIGIVESLYKYYFYTRLPGYHIFIYLFLMLTTLAFVFFLITLATGIYYKNKKKAYDDYIKKINRVKRKGKYASQLKYTISLMVGFSFFLFALGISGKIALKSKDEIYIVIFILLLLGFLGFIKSVRKGLFYSFISKQKKRKESVSAHANGEIMKPEK